MGLLLVLLILAVVAGLVWLGYRGAEHDLADARDDLDTQRQVLDAEWTALEQTRRVNDVFFQARDAMRRAEADRQDQG
jgi:cell division protein FtsL